MSVNKLKGLFSKVPDFVFHSRPRNYGILYLFLIPIFGFLYYFLPGTIGKPGTTVIVQSWVECVYFSAVTMTTLGYGDIAPISDLGRNLAVAESVLGITLIGLFLNALSRVRGEVSRSEEILKEEEAYRAGEVSKLSGCYSLLYPLAELHKSSVAQVTNPISKRSGAKYDPNFTFNDMKDLFRPSTLLGKGYTDPAIKHYYLSLSPLTGEIAHLIKFVDLRLFPKLKQHCVNFVIGAYMYDCSGAILGATSLSSDGVPFTETIRGFIESHVGQVDFSQGGMLNPYVALYRQIKEHMQLLQMIQDEIGHILNF